MSAVLARVLSATLTLVTALTVLPAMAQEDGTRRYRLAGELRFRIDATDSELGDGTSTDDADLQLRLRFGVAYDLSQSVLLKARLAGRVSTGGNDWSFDLDAEGQTLQPGEASFDELYVKWNAGKRLDLFVGRMQTQFQLRGVFTKSLDRKDSNNMRVTWTDGAHLTYRATNGWSSHFIMQYNPEDGATAIRRAPLDFTDSASRLTYFVNVRNDRRWKALVQRAFDVSYLPSSLLKDGTLDGRVVDYWGLVTRWTAEWHPWEGEMSIMSGGELAYAPETPTRQAQGLPGGDSTASGWAWQAQAGLMNFRPGQSIALNLGVAESGWLLSPQFRENDKLAEIRYRKLFKRGGLLEVRIRYREAIDPLVGEPQRRRDTDGYVRFTRRF